MRSGLRVQGMLAFQERLQNQSSHIWAQRFNSVIFSDTTVDCDVGYRTQRKFRFVRQHFLRYGSGLCADDRTDMDGLDVSYHGRRVCLVIYLLCVGGARHELLDPQSLRGCHQRDVCKDPR